MDENKRVSLLLRGLDIDQGDVRFKDFIQQLDIIKKSLLETRKLYSKKPFAYFKVVELSHSSPAFIVLEAVPNRAADEPQTQALVDKFFQSLEEIERGEYPENFRYETFTAYKDITSLRDKKKITEIIISRNGDSPRRLENLSNNIEQIMGTDQFEVGSYMGMLEAINIHNQNVLFLYPTSHLPKLKCVFPQRLREEAISAVGQYITVIGTKKFKPNVSGGIPYEMRVTSLYIHPSEEDLPTLADLKGIAPNATGDEKSEDFVRGIRDEW